MPNALVPAAAPGLPIASAGPVAGVSPGLAAILARWPVALAELREARDEAEAAQERHSDMFGDTPLPLDGVRLPAGLTVDPAADGWELRDKLNRWREGMIAAARRLSGLAPEAAEAAMAAIRVEADRAAATIAPVEAEEKRRRDVSGLAAASARVTAAWFVGDEILKAVVEFEAQTLVDIGAQARFAADAGREDDSFEWALMKLAARLAGKGQGEA